MHKSRRIPESWRQTAAAAAIENAASGMLNRVIGPDPSVILGTLISNGRVFLVNPGAPRRVRERG